MILAFGIIKLSITFYYRRIVVIARGTLFDWITKIAIVIVLLWTIGCLFSSIFACGTHIFANWGSSQDSILYCGPSYDVNSAFVVSDLITDVMVLCLPLPVVRIKTAEVSTADTTANVIDLESPNDGWKEIGSYWYLSDWGHVSDHLRNCKFDDID